MRARSILAAAALVSLWACDADDARPPAGRAEAAPKGAQTPVAGPAPIGSAAPEGCDLIPRAEIERLAGPLAGEPERDGNGCWYYVAMDTTSTEWQQLRDRAQQARAGGMDERAIELYHPTRAGIRAEVGLDAEGGARGHRGAAQRQADSSAESVTSSAPAPAGWDETSDSRTGRLFQGRTGHVRVTLRLQQLNLSPDTLVAIASRIRDRIPDGPIPHPAADRSGRPPAGRDPCGVLSQAEAEAELGKLVAAPFRSHERTPLADPSGKSCAYLTAGHHALVLTPSWDYGRIDLDAARMVGGVVRRVADLPGVEGDTLEGPWDDAAVDLTGELLLLKGPHALGVRYLTASTDAAGAIRLAGPALQRLAATPVADRPRVAAGDCVPESAVGEAFGSPARLKAGVGQMCYYDLAADPTVSIELEERPARVADQVFAQLQQRGQGADPARIALGEDGWAYSSESRAEAAARQGDKVYLARVVYPLSTRMPDRKDAMVRLVARMMK